TSEDDLRERELPLGVDRYEIELRRHERRRGPSIRQVREQKNPDVLVVQRKPDVQRRIERNRVAKSVRRELTGNWHEHSSNIVGRALEGQTELRPARASLTPALRTRDHARSSRDRAVFLPTPHMIDPDHREAPPAAGEEAAIRAIADLISWTVRRDHAPGALARRDAHPKHHGCVRAEFRVDADVPADLRYGIFAQPRVYPAWIRSS